MESTGYRAGGARRIDRVLAPSFVDDLASVDDEELRQRREMATAEEADLAYSERLVEGRLALVRAERAQRGRDEPAPRLGQRSDDEIVAGLAAALVEPAGRDGARGRRLDDEAREVVDAGSLSVVPSRPGVYQRDAERAFADLRLSDLGALDEAGLDEAAERLEEFEHRLTNDRDRVVEVLRVLRRESAARGHSAG